MKTIVSTPRAVLIARQELVNQSGLCSALSEITEHDAAEYIADGGDARHAHPGTWLAKFAGQLCYASFGPKRSKWADRARYFANIREKKHTSILEHATYTFFVYRCSRSVTHEQVRHRHLSPSQWSQRYIDPLDSRIIIRPELEPFATQVADVLDGVSSAIAFIGKHLPEGPRKVVNQALRDLLPGMTEAPMIVTGNARAWREYLAQRLSPAADTQIRALAQQILSALVESDPDLFGDLEGGE